MYWCISFRKCTFSRREDFKKPISCLFIVSKTFLFINSKNFKSLLELHNSNIISRFQVRLCLRNRIEQKWTLDFLPLIQKEQAKKYRNQSVNGFFSKCIERVFSVFYHVSFNLIVLNNFEFHICHIYLDNVNTWGYLIIFCPSTANGTERPLHGQQSPRFFRKMRVVKEKRSRNRIPKIL